jgi:hypothetical protein
MATDGVRVKNAADQVSFARAYVEVLEQTYQAGLEKTHTLGRAVFQPLSWSPLLPHIAKRAKTPADVITSAYKIRETRGARDLRKAIARMEQHLKDNNLKGALRCTREVQKLADTLQEDLGIRELAMTKMTLSLGGIGSAELPRRLIPGFLLKARYPLKPRFGFLRSVFDDLSTVASLGMLYEKLCPLEEPTQR